MEENDDKHPVINQRISGTKYERIPNGSDLSTGQANRQNEDKFSRNNKAMDENLTALYWG
jgi:hypothetical protein